MSPNIRRHRDFVIDLPRRGAKLSGHFRLETFQGEQTGLVDSAGEYIVREIPGTRRVRADFDNIITNQGLNYIGSQNDYGTYCHVGTGSTAEAVTDTALVTFTAYQSVASGYPNYSAQSTPPYYGSHIRKYRFTPNFGGGAVNISEVGIGRTTATGGLFSRALVKDGGGSPTTINVLATEYLDVYYTLRNYPDHVNYTTGATDDGSGSITISAVSYSYTIRCADITNYKYWGRNIMAGFGRHTAPSDYILERTYGSDAALGAVTSSPSATSFGSDLLTGDIAAASYSNDSYQNTLIYSYGLDDGNETGGIKAMWLPSTLGAYQLLFGTAIPKDNTETLTFNQRWAWTRKTL
jgi:hypothetical protein